MSEPRIRRASLAEIRKMKERGELAHDPNAPEGESLGPEFWANAKIEGPRTPRSVHLKLDPDVFAFGDCAACPWPQSGPGAILPPRAQVAHQQATLLAKSMRARLAGRPLPTFRFRDYGSLVSLGELSAVGSLMGGLIGGSLLVQGLIARWMYASLYKMHQVALHGVALVAFDTIGRTLRGGLEPRVKLH